MTLEFPLTISRSWPCDHEVEVQVTAVIERRKADPEGSLANAGGWEVIEAGAIDENGNEADGTSDQAQIEEAVQERIEKLSP